MYADESQNWQLAIIPRAFTIKQVIENLESSHMQIALVCDGEGTLLGTITDGDIRRGLLRGLTLSDDIETVINQHPLVASTGASFEVVQKLFKDNQVQQIPIINEKRRVIGLHLKKNATVRPQMDVQMVIMAGGRGTRLLPHTKNCPKPLLPIAGKPMLQHIIEKARGEGFESFTISVGHLGHMIREYFGSGRDLGVSIRYINETTPLGTAGALSLLPFNVDAPVIITNGDVMTEVKYAELLDFHNANNAIATMGVRRYDLKNPFGVVETAGVEIISLREKPVISSFIIAGLYVLSPDALRSLKTAEACDMPELFDRLRGLGSRCVAFPMHEKWADVGTEAEYLSFKGPEVGD